MLSFDVLLGMTLTKVVGKIGNDEMVFTTVDGRQFKLWHEQDCYECVVINDICGHLEDIVGSPITLADTASENDSGADESGTWTFYRLATVKGYVTIRWHGSSNGYYSESVDFTEI